MGNGADGPKGYLTCNSSVVRLPQFSFLVHSIGLRRRFARFYDIGALEHAQIAAIEWNRKGYSVRE